MHKHIKNVIDRLFPNEILTDTSSYGYEANDLYVKENKHTYRSDPDRLKYYKNGKRVNPDHLSDRELDAAWRNSTIVDSLSCESSHHSDDYSDSDPYYLASMGVNLLDE